MIVTHNITIDLRDFGVVPRIDATQDDQYTRNLAITLQEGGEAWRIPEDAAAVIRYCKSDGIGGEYDTLPDGSPAWWVEDNVLWLALAPQVLTAPGVTMLSASIILEEKVISIFSIAIHVRPRVQGIVAESAAYYNVAGFLPGPVQAEAGQYLRIAQVNENGRVVALEGAAGGGAGEVPGKLPRMFFGGALPQTKEDAVMSWRYVSADSDISGWCTTKAQGNSSMAYPKKNQTVKLYEDPDCQQKRKLSFRGWGPQSKFCCKANWIDLTHARNIVSARLWGDVVKSRESYEALPLELRTSPNQGAVDGFPVKVFADGVYQGRYTMNIPKDAWMANMDDSLDTHCILCSEGYGSGCFRAEANIDGNDWTDEIHDTVPGAIKTRWNEIIRFIMNSTDEEFRAGLGNYFYVDSLIDYHLFGLVSCGLDAYGKNQIYMTYDGQKWIASMYDMDSTWGLWWDGSTFVPSDYDRSAYQDFQDGEGNLLYIRLEECFRQELKDRWAQLKDGMLSREHILNRFEEFVEQTPPELMKEDYAETTGNGLFTGIPCQSTNHIQQLRAFIRARHAWCDNYVATMGEAKAVRYPMVNGSHQFTVGYAGECDITLTVSNGNHVHTNIVVPRDNMNANIGDITENTNSIHNVAGNVHNRSPIFSLKAGDVIRAVVTLSDQHTCTTAFSVYLAKANGTTSKDIFSGNASAEKTTTLTEDFDVGAIGMWVKTAVCVLDFDLELYVNEVRYI